MIVWHEDEKFWQLRYQLMYTAERLAATPGEVDGMVALLGAAPPMRILDLCCGPGRHAIELARRGYVVTGVDRTAPYIARAREAVQAAGVPVELVEEDMRGFRRDQAFDCAVNMFTAFGYFRDPAEDRRVIENLHASLVPGGRLLMELLGREILARKFQPRSWFEHEGALFLEDRKIEDDWTWISTRQIFIQGNDRWETSMDHRLYAASDLTRLLRDVGFSQTRVYGSLAGIPYDQDAQRLVVVATV